MTWYWEDTHWNLGLTLSSAPMWTHYQGQNWNHIVYQRCFDSNLTNQNPEGLWVSYLWLQVTPPLHGNLEGREFLLMTGVSANDHQRCCSGLMWTSNAVLTRDSDDALCADFTCVAEVKVMSYELSHVMLRKPHSASLKCIQVILKDNTHIYVHLIFAYLLLSMHVASVQSLRTKNVQ